MGGLFSPPSLPPVSAPPPVPTLDTASVQASASDEVKKRAMAQGRASTYLTETQSQRTAQPSAQRTLAGVV